MRLIGICILIVIYIFILSPFINEIYDKTTDSNPRYSIIENIENEQSLTLTGYQYYTLKTLFAAIDTNLDKLEVSAANVISAANSAGTPLDANNPDIVKYDAATKFITDLFIDLELTDAKITTLMSDTVKTNKDKIEDLLALLNAHNKIQNETYNTTTYTEEIELSDYH